MKIVYADFMKIDYCNRLLLTCLGTINDLERQKIELRRGKHLVFYNEDEDENGVRDDLVIDGIVDYDEENKRWVAVIDWDKIKNISQLTSMEKKKLGIL
jgi:hypothetical protein